MCGIAGIVNLGNLPPSMELLQAMGLAMAHRGPDDAGIQIMGGTGLCHRRLSIIDLSVRAHQPMGNEDASIWIVFNGEIYNYRELTERLKALGHRFQSESDTEVIIHAYEEYGIRCLEHLNGMFAFAIWDDKKKRFFAARDRIGIKPFYYFWKGKELVFGSEIKSLLLHPALSFDVNSDAVRDYMVFGYNLDDSTWYKGIRKLPPAHYLLLENGEMHVNAYWDIRFDPDTSLSPGNVREELRFLLKSAIHSHLRSDVPLGAHLSGGIDSSTVVALATEALGGRIHTFSGAFDEGRAYDERSYINLVSKHFDTIHHQVVPVADELPAMLPSLLWHLDEPVVGPGVFSQFRVCQLVAESGVKVVNGGQGGDEQFGGYPRYYPLALKNLFSWTNGKGAFPPLREFMSVPYYLMRSRPLERIKRRMYSRLNQSALFKQTHAQAQSALDRLEALIPGKMDPFERQAYMDLKCYLPGLLQVEDRTSMACSIESRVPLLDHRITEFSAQIPSWMKVKNGVLKSVLRETMRGTVPDAILDRKDKMGFPTPISFWFAGPLVPWLRRTLLDRSLLAGDLLDAGVLKDMLENHFNGVEDNSSQIWSALCVEMWMRGNIEGWKNLEGWR